MPDTQTLSLTLDTCYSVEDIPRADWDRLAGQDNPFLRYEFFQALERSGCTSRSTGWEPSHLIFRLDGEIAGLAPAYLKTHSMGEYVFDWSWAQAYHQHGLDYYPKLLMAIPFTPSQGPRLLLSRELRGLLDARQLHELFDNLMHQLGGHSWHLLFPDARDRKLLGYPQELRRLGCQFHWHNRKYETFDGFLEQLTSRKRKSIRRERRQVAEQGIVFSRFHGEDIPDDVMEAFYTFYQATYLKRGQRPYLNRQFFELIRVNLPEHLHLVMARKNREWVGGALFLTSKNTLYGRYWGCLEEYPHLHFETCYYQGIELAIELGLSRFDAGAQGEHKLVRGFEPQLTHSWHGISHPGFRDAIRTFIRDEAAQVDAYFQESFSFLPYKQQDQD
ncbi:MULTISPECIES: GNAT family N-acetyltransferase [Marinobacter]|uniref:GNAT family N-acetyltransferase n=1 Tax=Marinobacter suaedae TaxID=3057675 RepID=A0ABT8VWZ1_9GAMM|nr:MULTISPECIES: GNAT family N-acetyltransferase [unclassified Marinobacter]MBZ2168621.1 GNAT family N-acetyltransferase [Marinobacter sp. F4216]MDO3720505.1 GNAT family N-acetyltransferase [Marinobacter sp. chi1]